MDLATKQAFFLFFAIHLPPVEEGEFLLYIMLKFAVPVILGNLFQLFYTLADSVIVGKTLGADSDLLSAGSPDSQMDADPG